LLVGVCLLWWVTGGIFVGAAVLLGWPLAVIGGPWWLAPLIAIPAGPAWAALANVTHRAARDIHVDRSFFTDGLRTYWKQALGVNAITMGVLMLLFINLLFYISRPQPVIQALTILFLLLLVYWAGVLVYVFAVLVGMKAPSVLGAVKMAAVMAFANPLFSVLIVVIAALLTGLSVVLAILVLIAWPGLMLLLGSHSLKLMVEMAGGTVEGSDNSTPASDL